MIKYHTSSSDLRFKNLHVILETYFDPDAWVRHPMETLHIFSVQSHRSWQSTPKYEQEHFARQFVSKNPGSHLALTAQIYQNHKIRSPRNWNYIWFYNKNVGKNKINLFFSKDIGNRIQTRSNTILKLFDVI